MNSPINPIKLTHDLGGIWYRSYGVAALTCSPLSPLI